MPFQNPLTEVIYKQKRNNVVNRFPFLTSIQHIISFEDYYKATPQRYYNKEAFSDFLYFLNILKSDCSHTLNRLLIEREEKISLAITNLESVNSREIHNVALPKELYLSHFIQENILFNLLKLWESPLCEFLYIVAFFSRNDRGVSTDKLDIFNIVEELKFLPTNFERFKKYKHLYNNTIRNGIGHGKVEYLEGRINFIARNEIIVKENRQIVGIFDDLLDVLNGFCFALKTFYLINKDYLNEQNINIPNSIMLQEVVASTSAPKWNIKGYLESTIQDKKHINIFVETEFRDLTTLRINIFHTGILAAELTNKYDIITLQLQNKLSGLAVIDAKKVREISLTHPNPQLVDYIQKAYFHNLELLFFSKPDSWNILRRINTMRYIAQLLIPIYFKHFYKKFRRKYEIISTNIHSKKCFNVVEGKVILDSTKIEDIQLYVKKNYKSIIKEVVKNAKADKGIFSTLWLLPAKFVTVQIYSDNVRVRESRISKTKGIQVCSLRLNSTKSIETPIAFPNSTDVMGNYSILWIDYLDEIDL